LGVSAGFGLGNITSPAAVEAHEPHSASGSLGKARDALPAREMEPQAQSSFKRPQPAVTYGNASGCAAQTSKLERDLKK